MPTMRVIAARWPGTCRSCGVGFPAGTPIRWFSPDRAAGEKGRSAVEHEQCHAPAPAPEPPAPPAPESLPADAIERVVNLVLERLTEKTPLSIKIERSGGNPVTVNIAHPELPTLLALAAARVHTYLYGPAGTGKDHASRTVAEVLGLTYRSHTWCQRSTLSALFGYNDAMGRYMSTPTRDIWEHGGVLYYDEIDNAPADVLSALNTMLASNFADFPDARVPKHHDCIILAAGNTPGYGPTLAFPDRRPLPTATRTRFHFLYWGYDRPTEFAVSKAIAATVNVPAAAARMWTGYVLKLREHCTISMPQVIPSPRASYHGTALLATFPVATVADMVLFQGLDASLVDMLMRVIPLPTITLEPPDPCESKAEA